MGRIMGHGMCEGLMMTVGEEDREGQKRRRTARAGGREQDEQ